MAKPTHHLHEKKWTVSYTMVLVFNAILIILFYILKLIFNI